MEISSCRNMGDRCRNERHRFRIGIDDRYTTGFEAGESDFLRALENAIIDHNLTNKPGKSYTYLQVWTTDTAKWRNVQNRGTGDVVAVTPQIAGQPETAANLFLWACDSVQMGRDIDAISKGLSREAAENE